MKSSVARLALDLGLTVVSLFMMCIANQRLFIVGLAMLVLSGFVSLRPIPHMTWQRWVAVILLGILGVWAMLWLSAYGRQPLDPTTACVIGGGVVTAEIMKWSAHRNVPT